MPTCTTIIMHRFNPIVSIIADGVERALSSRRIPAVRWVRSIIAAALEARLAANNGRRARIPSPLLVRGKAIKRHKLEQSP